MIDETARTFTFFISVWGDHFDANGFGRSLQGLVDGEVVPIKKTQKVNGSFVTTETRTRWCSKRRESNKSLDFIVLVEAFSKHCPAGYTLPNVSFDIWAGCRDGLGGKGLFLSPEFLQCLAVLKSSLDYNLICHALDKEI